MWQTAKKWENEKSEISFKASRLSHALAQVKRFEKNDSSGEQIMLCVDFWYLHVNKIFRISILLLSTPNLIIYCNWIYER